MAVTGSGPVLKRGIDRCVTGSPGGPGSQCVTSGRKIALASPRRRPPRAMPAAQALPGRKPACRLGRQAWTAPCGCGFARRLDGAAGAALCPSLAMLAAHAPAVRLRPPRCRAVPQKPTPRLACGRTLAYPTRHGRAGPRGEGVAFWGTARHRGGGASPPNDDRRAGARLAPLAAGACQRLPQVSASSSAPPRPSAWPRAVCPGRAAPASRLPEICRALHMAHSVEHGVLTLGHPRLGAAPCPMLPGAYRRGNLAALFGGEASRVLHHCRGRSAVECRLPALSFVCLDEPPQAGASRSAYTLRPIGRRRFRHGPRRST